MPIKTIGQWLTPEGWVKGACHHGSNVIKLVPQNSSELSPRFLPAPVDLHIHGGGGADVMQGDEALRTVLRTHASYGTGAMLATSVTAPVEQIDEFLASVKRVMQSPPECGAHLLGVHLEGPFINPDKLGAQPDFPIPLDLSILERWLSSGIVRVITYAPELDIDGHVPELCQRYGVRAQLGHTVCSWAQASAAINQGVGVTHLYNAMSAVKHREGGAALAALAYAEFAEVITDGIHVDRAAFDAAKRAIPGLYSVTDATSAAGMPDGQFKLGSLTITKEADRVVLEDGTLAGSCLTQQRSIEVLRSWDLEWEAISRLCSSMPARWLGAADYGVINTGAHANWLELDEQGLSALWLSGKRYDLGDK
ncbi:MAG: N-acetylglucosamine-6-phosphate deacetylase [Granulosicoccus sp.]